MTETAVTRYDDEDEPLPVQEQLDRLDHLNWDTHVRLNALARRVRDLERPPPAKLPPRYFRYPLEKAIAGLDQRLADGAIDQETYDDCVHNLRVSDRFWREHPDGAITIDLEDLARQVVTSPTIRHLHAVDTEPDNEESDEVDVSHSEPS